MVRKPPVDDPTYDGLVVETPQTSAAGPSAVTNAMVSALRDLGPVRTLKLLSKINQKDGFDSETTPPSETRKPAASSTSFPGVRIVTTSDRPPIRISSGSSAASTSSVRREPRSPVIRVTRRRIAIRCIAHHSDHRLVPHDLPPAR